MFTVWVVRHWNGLPGEVGNGECLIPGGVQGLVEWGSEQPGELKLCMFCSENYYFKRDTSLVWHIYSAHYPALPTFSLLFNALIFYFSEALHKTCI